jgi:hypothetical protein
VEPINALAWVTAVATVLLIVAAALAERTGHELRQGLLTRWLETMMPRAERRIAQELRAGSGGLEAMVQDATVHRLQERLSHESPWVRVAVTETLAGPRLHLLLDDTTLEFCLYRSPGEALAHHRVADAILGSMSFVEPFGWLIELHTLDGRIRCAAWRLHADRVEPVAIS